MCFIVLVLGYFSNMHFYTKSECLRADTKISRQVPETRSQ